MTKRPNRVEIPSPPLSRLRGEVAQLVGRTAEIASTGIYAACYVANSVDLSKWAMKALGSSVKPEEMHCTVCYSKQPFDVSQVPEHYNVKIPRNDKRRVARLGDKGAVVLHLTESEASALTGMWQSYRNAGASWDYPSYQPHITLSYDTELTDEQLDELLAYDGPIMLNKPTVKPLEENYKPKEQKETAALAAGLKVGSKVQAPDDSGKVRNAIISRIGRSTVIVEWDDSKGGKAKVRQSKVEPRKAGKAAPAPKPPLKTAAPLKKTTPKKDTSRDAIIKEIKGWIKKYKTVSSDTAAEKYKQKIYEALDKHGIKREEVGLKPVKPVAKPAKKPTPKPAPKKPGAKKTPIPVPPPAPPIEDPNPPKPKKLPGQISTKFPGRRPNIPYEMVKRGDAKVKLLYLRQLWDILNADKFQGKLPKPADIVLTKAVKVERFRRRGVWYPTRRIIGINPHVFNNPDGLYEVFLHEMCHQAVTDISKLGYREPEQGHGPVWKSWMVKVGLDPNRYDKTGNLDYMDEETREKELKKREAQKQAEAQETPLPSHLLRPMQACKWRNPKTGIWQKGLIVRKHDQAGKRWVHVSHENDIGAWSIVPPNYFFKVTPEEERSLSISLEGKFRSTLDYLTKVDQLKKEKRQRRKDIRSWLSY